MTEKQWYEKTWNEMNSVRLINLLVSWSEAFDFTSWEPTEEEQKEYRLMWEKAKKIDPQNYKLLGVVRPEFFRKDKGYC